MSTRIRLAVTGLLLQAFAAVAVADGINPSGVGQNLGGGLNFDAGISKSGGGVVTPPTGCTGTGADFTNSCNSQYLVVFL